MIGKKGQLALKKHNKRKHRQRDPGNPDLQHPRHAGSPLSYPCKKLQKPKIVQPSSNQAPVSRQFDGLAQNQIVIRNLLAQAFELQQNVKVKNQKGPGRPENIRLQARLRLTPAT
jgi:hypothetical protein